MRISYWSSHVCATVLRSSLSRRARFVVTPPAYNLSTAAAGFKSLSLPSPLRTALNLVVSLLLTFLGLLFVTFIIGRVVPIDPVLAIVGDRAPGHVVERVREELGLNRPLYEQFAIYVWDVLQGDLGTSVLTANPVIEDIKRVFPATLELATVATLFGVL